MGRVGDAAICAIVFLAATGTDNAELARPPSVAITISGIVTQPLALSSADIAALPHEHLAVGDDDESPATYDGVELHLLLERAGVGLGTSMHGPRLLDYAIVSASDGFRAGFSLAELHPAFAERRIILADRRNGAALDAKHGPLRIVVPDEKRHVRWVREVTSIAVAYAGLDR